MKNIITLLSLSIGIISFSQVELHKGGQPLGSTMTAIPITDNNSNIDRFTLGETTIVGTDTLNHEVYIVNTGTTDEIVTYQRIRRHHTEGWWGFCSDLIMFSMDDIDTWNRPVNPILTVYAGDSSIFDAVVFPNEIDGCAIYTYIIKSGDNATFADSVQVTYTITGINCFLGTNEIETSLNYSVYPNPVNDLLHISIAENNTSISIFDILGKNVSDMQLVNGNNTLNIENLNPGVYFYSIKRNGVVIETQKLVVR
jgi:hypothetical protein